MSNPYARDSMPPPRNPERRFFVRAFVPVDAEEVDLTTLGEATSELEQAVLIQPENLFQIMEVDEGGMVDAHPSDLAQAALRAATTIDEFLSGAWDGNAEGWEAVSRILKSEVIGDTCL